LREREFFLDAAAAFERCAPLAARAAADGPGAPVPARFRHVAVRALYDAAASAAKAVADALGNNEIESALQAASAWRAPVDGYFDAVMVMDEDQAVRANRLAQLVAVTRLLGGIGDFSRLAL
jgi:glycyl-tRNA synthetase beta chain